MSRMKMMAVAFATMLCIVNVNAQTVEDVNTEYKKGSALLKSKKIEEAIPVFEKVVTMGTKVGPDAMVFVSGAKKTIPNCHFALGMRLAKAGKLEEAIVKFNKAAELGELYSDVTVTVKSKSMVSKAYTMLASQAFNAKDYAKAASIFAKGYEANSKDTGLGLNLAMSYCEMGDAKGYKVNNDIMALGKTHSKYEKDAAVASQKYMYYKMLEANKCAQAKDYTGFYTVIDEILKSDPTNSVALMLTIQVANNSKDFDKVIAYGDRAIAAQTEAISKGNATFLVASAYDNKKDKTKAIEYYGKVTAGDNVAKAKAQIVLLNKEIAAAAK